MFSENASQQYAAPGKTSRERKWYFPEKNQPVIRSTWENKPRKGNMFFRKKSQPREGMIFPEKCQPAIRVAWENQSGEGMVFPGRKTSPQYTALGKTSREKEICYSEIKTSREKERYFPEKNPARNTQRLERSAGRGDWYVLAAALEEGLEALSILLNQSRGEAKRHL